MDDERIAYIFAYETEKCVETRLYNKDWSLREHDRLDKFVRLPEVNLLALLKIDKAKIAGSYEDERSALRKLIEPDFKAKFSMKFKQLADKHPELMKEVQRKSNELESAFLAAMQDDGLRESIRNKVDTGDELMRFKKLLTPHLKVPSKPEGRPKHLLNHERYREGLDEMRLLLKRNVGLSSNEAVRELNLNETENCFRSWRDRYNDRFSHRDSIENK